MEVKEDRKCQAHCLSGCILLQNIQINKSNELEEEKQTSGNFGPKKFNFGSL